MKVFHWNSPQWWQWFTCHRRRPSLKAILGHLDSHDAFAVFHGCRPKDVGSYYANGLQIADFSSLNQLAHEVFLAPECPSVSAADIVAASTAIMATDHGNLYVLVDERELIGYCGHYLIYGSEHVCGIAAQLTRKYGFDFRQLLKRRGTPTVFRVRLALSEIPRDQLVEVAHHIRLEMWEERRRSDPPIVRWSFTLTKSISAQQIIEHRHPEIIPDPLLENVLYRYREMSTL